MRRPGTPGWGKRWIAALEDVLGGQAGRLARGRTYARAGRVHDLRVAGGDVTAQVTGTAAAPYRVNLQVEPLPDPVWSAAIAAMAEKAQFVAALLGAEMPRGHRRGVSRGGAQPLSRQAQRSDGAGGAACPVLLSRRGRPVQARRGDALRARRGARPRPVSPLRAARRAREEVLLALREARAAEAKVARETVATESIGEDLRAVDPADYDRAPEPLPLLHFSFDAEERSASGGSVLRQLGAPPGWGEGSSPAEAFSPLVRRAAEAAREAALAQPRRPTTTRRGTRRENR